jgi:rhomboid protease GluP
MYGLRLSSGFTTQFMGNSAPKNLYTTRLPAQGLAAWEVVYIAVRACEQLQWPFNISEGLVTAQTPRSWKSYGEAVEVLVEGDEIVITGRCIHGERRDGGRNQANVEEKFIPAFKAQLTAVSPAAVAEGAAALEAQTLAARRDFEERAASGNYTADERIVLGIGGLHVTIALVALNVLVFIAMAVSGVGLFEPAGTDVLKWGGNYRVYTLTGQWWRLLTNVFVHIGLIHLLFNMYALFMVGRYLEPLLGKVKFAVAYLCTGILASVVSIAWSGDRVSAGASGAIFGLYGLFLALLTTSYLSKQVRNGMLQSIGIFVVYNLLYGMKSGIDNAAHVGGLVSGFVAGYLFYLLTLKPQQVSYARSLLAAGILLLGTLAAAGGYVAVAGKSDAVVYQQALERFEEVEDRVLNQLRRSDSLPGEAARAALVKDSILPGCRALEKEITATAGLKLPAEEQRKRALLQQYARLRLKSAGVLYEYYAGANKEAKVQEYNALDAEIAGVIRQLKQE